MNAPGASNAAPIRIPRDPYEIADRADRIYMGREEERTPLYNGDASRKHLARETVQRVGAFLPCAPHSPEMVEDLFTVIGRIYLEMSEFVEIAGPTCWSPEAAPWCAEAALRMLGRLNVQAHGRPVALVHAPTDYGDRRNSEQGAHSMGCHFNLGVQGRGLDEGATRLFIDLVSPLNVIFGPGGLTWREGTLRFSCDPRADHIRRLQGSRAHGESPKPFVMSRDEPLATPPYHRCQVTAFAAPRSPVSAWLQAELLVWAFRAAVAGRRPPWRVEHPIDALQAASADRVHVRQGADCRPATIRKADLAVDTVDWLADLMASSGVVRRAGQRLECVRNLAVSAAAASVNEAAAPPVFPTDIAVKRILFDRAARAHGFDGLAGLGRAWRTGSARRDVDEALDALIVTDALFSSPNESDSTYHLAARANLFTPPEFDLPINLSDLARLPDGVCQRDRDRALLLADPERRRHVLCCDWHLLHMVDGSVQHIPDPWSSLRDARRRPRAFRKFWSRSEPAAAVDSNARQAVSTGGATAMNTDSRPAEDDGGDELLPAAIEVITEAGRVSVSLLQRRLEIGYRRAARLVALMASLGVVDESRNSRPGGSPPSPQRTAATDGRASP